MHFLSFQNQGTLDGSQRTVLKRFLGVFVAIIPSMVIAFINVFTAIGEMTIIRNSAPETF